TGEIFGSPAYMSPEQSLGKKVDARSDQYSLGCVIYECLTGNPPFIGDTAVEVMMQHVDQEPPPIKPSKGKSVPSAVHSLVRKLLAKEPAARFATASEVVAEIDEIMAAPTGMQKVIAQAQSTDVAGITYVVAAVVGAVLMLPIAWWAGNSLLKMAQNQAEK